MLGWGGSGESGRRGGRVSLDLYVKLKKDCSKKEKKEKEMKVEVKWFLISKKSKEEVC